MEPYTQHECLPNLQILRTHPTVKSETEWSQSRSSIFRIWTHIWLYWESSPCSRRQSNAPALSVFLTSASGLSSLPLLWKGALHAALATFIVDHLVACRRFELFCLGLTDADATALLHLPPVDVFMVHILHSPTAMYTQWNVSKQVWHSYALNPLYVTSLSGVASQLTASLSSRYREDSYLRPKLRILFQAGSCMNDLVSLHSYVSEALPSPQRRRRPWACYALHPAREKLPGSRGLECRSIHSISPSKSSHDLFNVPCAHYTILRVSERGMALVWVY